jgi:hypothetical protein
VGGDRELHPFEARVLVAMDEVLRELPEPAYESEFAIRNAEESLITVTPREPGAAAIHVHIGSEVVDFSFGSAYSTFELEGPQAIDDLRSFMTAVVQGRCGEVLGMVSRSCWLELDETGRRATSSSLLHPRLSRVERRFEAYR